MSSMAIGLVAVVIIIILLLVILFASCCGSGEGGSNWWGNGNGCCPQRRPCLRSSNLPGLAPNIDPTTLGSWGTDSSGGDIWVAESANGTVTLFDAAGVTVKNVNVPAATGSEAPSGRPSGLEINRACSDTALVASSAGATGSVLWLVATLDGTVAAYAPTVSGTDAITVIDNSVDEAYYTGVSIGYVADTLTGDCCRPCGPQTYTPRIYVANFLSGFVEIYDSSFNFISEFTDPSAAPSTPPGFAPFNVKACCGFVYVAFALQNDTFNSPVSGANLGFIDVFDLQGVYVSRLATGGQLNSPYGLSFTSRNELLVGNFGDGKILSYKVSCVCGQVFGCFQDYVRACKCQCHNEPLQFDGLLGLSQGSCGALHFASSPSANLSAAATPYGLTGDLICCKPKKKRSCFSLWGEGC